MEVDECLCDGSVLKSKNVQNSGNGESFWKDAVKKYERRKCKLERRENELEQSLQQMENQMPMLMMMNLMKQVQEKMPIGGFCGNKSKNLNSSCGGRQNVRKRPRNSEENCFSSNRSKPSGVSTPGSVSNAPDIDCSGSAGQISIKTLDSSDAMYLQALDMLTQDEEALRNRICELRKREGALAKIIEEATCGLNLFDDVDQNDIERMQRKNDELARENEILLKQQCKMEQKCKCATELKGVTRELEDSIKTCGRCETCQMTMSEDLLSTALYLHEAALLVESKLLKKKKDEICDCLGTIDDNRPERDGPSTASSKLSKKDDMPINKSGSSPSMRPSSSYKPSTKSGSMPSKGDTPPANENSKLWATLQSEGSTQPLSLKDQQSKISEKPILTNKVSLQRTSEFPNSEAPSIQLRKTDYESLPSLKRGDTEDIVQIDVNSAKPDPQKHLPPAASSKQSSGKSSANTENDSRKTDSITHPTVVSVPASKASSVSERGGYTKDIRREDDIGKVSSVRFGDSQGKEESHILKDESLIKNVNLQSKNPSEMTRSDTEALSAQSSKLSGKRSDNASKNVSEPSSRLPEDYDDNVQSSHRSTKSSRIPGDYVENVSSHVVSTKSSRVSEENVPSSRMSAKSSRSSGDYLENASSHDPSGKSSKVSERSEGNVPSTQISAKSSRFSGDNLENAPSHNAPSHTASAKSSRVSERTEENVPSAQISAKSSRFSGDNLENAPSHTASAKSSRVSERTEENVPSAQVSAKSSRFSRDNLENAPSHTASAKSSRVSERTEENVPSAQISAKSSRFSGDNLENAPSHTASAKSSRVSERTEENVPSAQISAKSSRFSGDNLENAPSHTASAKSSRVSERTEENVPSAQVSAKSSRFSGDNIENAPSQMASVKSSRVSEIIEENVSNTQMSEKESKFSGEYYESHSASSKSSKLLESDTENLPSAQVSAKSSKTAEDYLDTSAKSSRVEIEKNIPSTQMSAKSSALSDGNAENVPSTQISNKSSGEDFDDAQMDQILDKSSKLSEKYSDTTIETALDIMAMIADLAADEQSRRVDDTPEVKLSDVKVADEIAVVKQTCECGPLKIETTILPTCTVTVKSDIAPGTLQSTDIVRSQSGNVEIVINVKKIDVKNEPITKKLCICADGSAKATEDVEETKSVERFCECTSEVSVTASAQDDANSGTVSPGLQSSSSKRSGALEEDESDGAEVDETLCLCDASEEDESDGAEVDETLCLCDASSATQQMLEYEDRKESQMSAKSSDYCLCDNSDDENSKESQEISANYVTSIEIIVIDDKLTKEVQELYEEISESRNDSEKLKSEGKTSQINKESLVCLCDVPSDMQKFIENTESNESFKKSSHLCICPNVYEIDVEHADEAQEETICKDGEESGEHIDVDLSKCSNEGGVCQSRDNFKVCSSEVCSRSPSVQKPTNEHAEREEGMLCTCRDSSSASGDEKEVPKRKDKKARKSRKCETEIAKPIERGPFSAKSYQEACICPASKTIQEDACYCSTAMVRPTISANFTDALNEANRNVLDALQKANVDIAKAMLEANKTFESLMVDTYLQKSKNRDALSQAILAPCQRPSRPAPSKCLCAPCPADPQQFEEGESSSTTTTNTKSEESDSSNKREVKKSICEKKASCSRRKGAPSSNMNKDEAENSDAALYFPEYYPWCGKEKDTDFSTIHSHPSELPETTPTDDDLNIDGITHLNETVNSSVSTLKNVVTIFPVFTASVSSKTSQPRDDSKQLDRISAQNADNKPSSVSVSQSAELVAMDEAVSESKSSAGSVEEYGLSVKDIENAAESKSSVSPKVSNVPSVDEEKNATKLKSGESSKGSRVSSLDGERIVSKLNSSTPSRNSNMPIIAENQIVTQSKGSMASETYQALTVYGEDTVMQSKFSVSSEVNYVISMKEEKSLSKIKSSEPSVSGDASGIEAQMYNDSKCNLTSEQCALSSKTIKQESAIKSHTTVPSHEINSLTTEEEMLKAKSSVSSKADRVPTIIVEPIVTKSKSSVPSQDNSVLTTEDGGIASKSKSNVPSKVSNFITTDNEDFTHKSNSNVPSKASHVVATDHDNLSSNAKGNVPSNFSHVPTIDDEDLTNKSKSSVPFKVKGASTVDHDDLTSKSKDSLPSKVSYSPTFDHDDLTSKSKDSGSTKVSHAPSIDAKDFTTKSKSSVPSKVSHVPTVDHEDLTSKSKDCSPFKVGYAPTTDHDDLTSKSKGSVAPKVSYAPIIDNEDFATKSKSSVPSKASRAPTVDHEDLTSKSKDSSPFKVGYAPTTDHDDLTSKSKGSVAPKVSYAPIIDHEDFATKSKSNVPSKESRAPTVDHENLTSKLKDNVPSKVDNQITDEEVIFNNSRSSAPSKVNHVPTINHDELTSKSKDASAKVSYAPTMGGEESKLKSSMHSKVSYVPTMDDIYGGSQTAVSENSNFTAMGRSENGTELRNTPRDESGAQSKSRTPSKTSDVTTNPVAETHIKSTSGESRKISSEKTLQRSVRQNDSILSEKEMNATLYDRTAESTPGKRSRYSLEATLSLGKVDGKHSSGMTMSLSTDKGLESDVRKLSSLKQLSQFLEMDLSQLPSRIEVQNVVLSEPASDLKSKIPQRTKKSSTADAPEKSTLSQHSSSKGMAAVPSKKSNRKNTVTPISELSPSCSCKDVCNCEDCKEFDTQDHPMDCDCKMCRCSPCRDEKVSKRDKKEIEKVGTPKTSKELSINKKVSEPKETPAVDSKAKSPRSSRQSSKASRPSDIASTASKQNKKQPSVSSKTSSKSEQNKVKKSTDQCLCYPKTQSVSSKGSRNKVKSPKDSTKNSKESLPLNITPKTSKQTAKPSSGHHPKDCDCELCKCVPCRDQKAEVKKDKISALKTPSAAKKVSQASKDSKTAPAEQAEPKDKVSEEKVEKAKAEPKVSSKDKVLEKSIEQSKSKEDKVASKDKVPEKSIEKSKERKGTDETVDKKDDSKGPSKDKVPEKMIDKSRSKEGNDVENVENEKGSKEVKKSPSCICGAKCTCGEAASDSDCDCLFCDCSEDLNWETEGMKQTCVEGAGQATSSAGISQEVSIKSFDSTKSGLKVALKNLQAKYKTKDRMIECMRQELAERCNSKTFEEMFRKMAAKNNEKPPSSDYDRTEICESLPRPIDDPKYGKVSERFKQECREARYQPGSSQAQPGSQGMRQDDSRSPQGQFYESNALNPSLRTRCICLDPLVDPAPLRITELKVHCPGSLFLKWLPSTALEVIGYEICVRDVLKQRVVNARRTMAVLHDVDFESEVPVFVYAVTKNGRCNPPAAKVFRVIKCNNNM